jgi:hypothetical protein
MKDGDTVGIISTNEVKTQSENSNGIVNMEDLARYNYNRQSEDGGRAKGRNVHVKHK